MNCTPQLVLIWFWGFVMGIPHVLAQPSMSYPKAEEISGLAVGDTVSDFSAVGVNVDTFQLYKTIAESPVVLIFYRGQWCPVCSRHISALQDSMHLIASQGATLVGVSPEKPSYAQQMADHTQAQFPLLYDMDYKIAIQFGVLFQPPKATRLLYNNALNANLQDAHSDDTERLPIPATYIIDQQGVIVWRHVEPDYKRRASVAAILQHLKD